MTPEVTGIATTTTSASEVTTIWRYTNVYIIIIIIIIIITTINITFSVLLFFCGVIIDMHCRLKKNWF